MDLEQDNVIGIVGGMGPEAGLALFNCILCHTKARVDQEHLSVILMSLPKHIVDRTSFLEGNEYCNPAYNVSKIIRKMENAGAKIIGIACNTSHTPEIFNVIVEELARLDSQIKLMNMPLETCLYLKENHPTVRRVGVMTTNGTYKSGIYRNLLNDLGYEVVVPDIEFQNDIIHRIIYDPEIGIKANPQCIIPETRLLMHKAINYFKNRNTEAIILGCTELPLLLAEQKKEEGLIFIDSIETFALALIREATAGRKYPSIVIH